MPCSMKIRNMSLFSGVIFYLFLFPNSMYMYVNVSVCVYVWVSACVCSPLKVHPIYIRMSFCTHWVLQVLFALGLFLFKTTEPASGAWHGNRLLHSFFSFFCFPSAQTVKRKK
jgi:hypothetical protein